MSKKTSGHRVQSVLRSHQASSNKKDHDRLRRPKTGPATQKATPAEPTPPVHQGCIGFRSGPVLVLRRTDIGSVGPTASSGTYNEPGGHKPKPTSGGTPERIAPEGSYGRQRFGRSGRHPSKRASSR